MRHIKSIILTMLTALFALPAIAQDFEYEGIWYTVIDAEAKTCRTKAGYSENDQFIPGNDISGDVVIPTKVYAGSIEYSVTEIGGYGFYNVTGLTSISLPESVTSIGVRAFFECSQLISVSLPQSLESIGMYAFYRNSQLTSISLPENLKTIDAAAFEGCSSITSVSLPESLTSIGVNAFWGCTGLTTVTLPANMPTSEYGIFGASRNIAEVTYNAEVPVASAEDLFDSETYIKATLNMPNATLEAVQAVSPWNKFQHITAKDGSVVPELVAGTDFEYEGLMYTVIDAEAHTCKTKDGYTLGLVVGSNSIGGNTVVGDLIIPSLVYYGNIEYTVVAIGNDGFINNSGLISVVIPETVTSIPIRAFWRATALKSVSFPATVNWIDENAFFGCSSLDNVVLPNGLKGVGDFAFHQCESLTSVVIPEGLTKLGRQAFSHCYNLKKIDIPSSVEEFGEAVFSSCAADVEVTYRATTPVATYDNLFSGSSYEKGKLNMPNATLEAVQAVSPWNKFLHIVASDGSIGEPLKAGEDFEYERIWYTVLDAEAKTVKTKEGDMSGEVWSPGAQCEGTLTIPATVSDGNINYTVTELGTASFTGNGITSVTLPETLTSLGGWTFYNCENLTSINIPTSVTKIGWGMFTNCKSLASIEIPDNIQEIEGWAFNGCSALTSVRIPASQTVLEENVFANCSSLASITLPSALAEMKGGVFNGCSSLQSISLPSTLTSIGEIAFSNCSGITSVTLPESLKSLGASAFLGCSNLVSVVIPAGIEGIGENAFAYCNSAMELTYNAVTPITAPDICNKELYTTATLYTPNATLEAVQANVPWNKFQRITASDGSVEPGLAAGEDFEYEGIWYTVLDTEAKTCRTKKGSVVDGVAVAGNVLEGDVVIPASVSDGVSEYTVVEIGYRSFSDTSITSIVLPESLISIEWDAFSGCHELASVEFPSSLESIGLAAFMECLSLTFVSLPESLTSIGANAFWNCPDLTSVTLPANMPTSEYGIFGASRNIAEVTYNADVPVVSAEDLFDSETYTKATLNMPNATLEAVQAVSPWNRFQRITASDGSIAPALAAGTDFKYEGIWYTVLDAEAKTCKTKDGHAENGMEISGNDFSGDLVIPETVIAENLEYRVVGIGNSGFENCIGLTSIKMAPSITTIENGAFNGCSNLSLVDIPESVTAIGVYAFNYCVSLENVILPDGLKEIGYHAFRGCTGLKSVTLPANMPASEDGIFAASTNIAEVTYNAVVPVASAEDLFDYETYTKATLKTPNATLEAVQTTVPWNKFQRITASDGSVEPGLAAGEDFEYEGIWYTVLDAEAKTCSSKSGHYEDSTLIGGNDYSGDLVIPSVVYAGSIEYSVTAIGRYGFANAIGLTSTVLPEGISEIPESSFAGCENLIIVSMPESVKTISVYAFNECSSLDNVKLPDGLTEIGYHAFRGCRKITSITLPSTLTNIGERLFIGCDELSSIEWQGQAKLPDDFIVEKFNPNVLLYVDSVQFAPEGMDYNIVADGRSKNIVLTPGYPFAPLYGFVAEHCEITKSFTQQTPLEGCEGWETMTIPFEPEYITTSDGRTLVPFAAMTGLDAECPFWLYEADSETEWKEASQILPGIPYLISMPNNDAYDEQYRIYGDVTFSRDSETEISMDICSPYAVTWNSGREFRSLWVPLDEAEAANALGLNVGITDLTNDEGQILPPGSAFHADVLPRPLEAYVTRTDGRRAMPVRGSQSIVRMLASDDGLRVGVDRGQIVISSESDRIVDVVTMDGVSIRRVDVKGGGATYRIDDLTRGIYIVAGRKITVR